MSNEENSSWEYKPGQNTDSAEPSPASPSADDAHGQANSAHSFSWTAAEYVEHQQGSSWYIMMVFLLLVIAAAIYFLTKDYFAVGATILAGLIAVIYTRRKPRQVTYQITSRDLSVGAKKYTYGMFKSFSIYREGDLSSINLQPIKRLAQPVAAYFALQDEQKVINLVGEHLPYEEHKLDVIDRLIRSLHL